MMIKKIVFISFVLISANGNAQHTEQQQWFSVVAKYNISDGFSASLEECWRISELSMSSQTYTTFGLGYKINKQFKAGFDFRFAQKGSFLNTENIDSRYNFDLAFKEKIGDVKINARTRFQSRYRDLNTSKYGKIPQNYSRNKIEFSYKLPSDLSIGFSTEFFIHLSEAKDMDRYLDEIRYGLSAEYRFGENHTLSAFWYYRDKMNYENPENINVIGLSYEFLINPSSKSAE